MHRSEGPDLLARHLRAVDALLQRRRQQRGPHEEQATVSAHVELSHDAVDNVRLRGEDVDGVHVALGLAAVLEALDVGDVGVEDVILLDDIVDQLLRVLVDNEYLPLRVVLVLVLAATGLGGRTSPRVIWRMVLRITALHVSECHRLHATASEQHLATYALAGYRSWTPSWRGAATSADKVHEETKTGGVYAAAAQRAVWCLYNKRVCGQERAGGAGRWAAALATVTVWGCRSLVVFNVAACGLRLARAARGGGGPPPSRKRAEVHAHESR